MDRLPRPCRYVARRFVFACQFAVGQTASGDLGHCQTEAVGIVLVLAIVVPEYLFIDIAKQMKRLNSNVGSSKAALQQRPEVLKAVRVDATAYITLGMIHDAMNEVVAYFVVADSVVGINFRSVFDVLEQDILQGLAGHVRYNFCSDLPQVPVKDSLNNRLAAMHTTLLYQPQLTVLVHVLRESAHECFVGLKFGIRPAQLRRGTERPIMKCGAETLKHEPCRFLRYAKSAMNLHARNAVLAIDQHPESSHPFVESKRRILKDRIDLERELPIAATAEPQLARLDEVVRLGAAPGAMNLAVRPTKANSVVEGALRIAEVNDGFLESAR